MFWWVRILGHTSPHVCVEADSEKEALSKAAIETKCPAIDEPQRLPYPANPCVGHISIPAFCQEPDRCAGRTGCPRTRSCTD